MNKRKYALLSLCLLMLAACSESDNDYDRTYPSILTELVELSVNADSLVTTLTTDDGHRYAVEQTIKAPVPDTLYRQLCSFDLADDGTTARIYQLQAVVSAKPRPADELNITATDPVRIISQWNTSRYLNIYMAYLTTGQGSHRFALREDSTTTQASGRRTVHVSLLHERPADDAESYTERIYLSLPAHLYEGQADSIALSIATYDGIKVFGY